jgi:hypothetical protein
MMRGARTVAFSVVARRVADALISIIHFRNLHGNAHEIGPRRAPLHPN